MSYDHIRHHYDLAGDCMYCGRSYVPGSTSFCPGKPEPKKSESKCQCGAETLYGKDTNLHSKIMPCPLYKEPK